MPHDDAHGVARNHKQRIAPVFDQVCEGYDAAALRFFPFTAERMVARLGPRAGWRVLDAATCTARPSCAATMACGWTWRCV